MVRGGIVPKKPLAFGKPCREKFKAQMPEYIVGNLIEAEEKQGVDMHGNYHNQNGTNKALNKSFVRVK